MNENNLKNKKSNNVIIVILSILLTLSITYIVYDIINEKNMFSNGDNQSTENNNVLPEEKEELNQLSLENELVKELYERTQYNPMYCEAKPYFLKYNIKIKEKILVENLSDSDKINLVTANIEEEPQEDSEKTRAYLFQNQILMGLEKIFGKNYTFDRTKTKGNMDCNQFEYNPETDKYEAIWFCGNVCAPAGKHVLTELYDAKQGTDYIELYQVLAYDEVTEVIALEHDWLKKIYKDESRKEIIDDNFEKNESLVKYAEQLPQYKYTFKKDTTTGNYYFYSIERVN